MHFLSRNGQFLYDKLAAFISAHASLIEYAALSALYFIIAVDYLQ